MVATCLCSSIISIHFKRNPVMPGPQSNSNGVPIRINFQVQVQSYSCLAGISLHGNSDIQYSLGRADPHVARRSIHMYIVFVYTTCDDEGIICISISFPVKKGKRNIKISIQNHTSSSALMLHRLWISRSMGQVKS